MNNLNDVGIVIPFCGYSDEESIQEYDFSSFFFCGVRIQTQTVMTFPILFVKLGFNLRSEFSGIHILMLAS